MSETTLRDLVLKRLEADTKPEDEWSALVLAALEGPDNLAMLLDEEGAAGRPRIAFLRAVTGRLCLPAGEAELRAESLFQGPDLTLESVDPRLERRQLGLQILLRQPLLDLVEPPFHSFEAAFDPPQPFFHPPQAGHEHLVLGFQPVETLVDRVEVGVEPGEPCVHLVAQPAHDPLDVGQDDLPVEPRQDRDQVIGHRSYPTSLCRLRATINGPKVPPTPDRVGPEGSANV